jgi:hypothetical protein
MPRPVLLFTWDGWWNDMKCSFVGPSSLFQRYNLQTRANYLTLLSRPLLPQYFSSNDNSKVVRMCLPVFLCGVCLVIEY